MAIFWFNCIAISLPESNRRTLNNPLTFLGDALQHYLALSEDFAVGEADDNVAEFVEVRRAGLIVFDLLGVGIIPATSCPSAVIGHP